MHFRYVQRKFCVCQIYLLFFLYDTKWSMGSCICLCCFCCCHRQWCEMTFNKRHKRVYVSWACIKVCVHVYVCDDDDDNGGGCFLSCLIALVAHIGICVYRHTVQHSAFVFSPDSFLTADVYVYWCASGLWLCVYVLLHECLSWLCKCHRDRECKCAKIDIYSTVSMFTFCVVWCVFHCFYMSYKENEKLYGFSVHFVSFWCS